MHVLALDTTTLEGSVALVDGSRTLAEQRGDATRTHGERLPAELLALVECCGMGIRSIDVFAVASGPGSFTGLRIGIATIQGLALSIGRPVVAVSGLDALAHSLDLEPPGTVIAAWMDARRGEVFTALYRVSEVRDFSPERLVELEGPAVGTPEATLARWADRLRGGRVVFVGDGALRYADRLRNGAPPGWSIAAEVPRLAGTIGRLAAVRAARGEAIGPAAVQPLYVRRPDAEIARAAATASGGKD
jgi:tRNA threonylcarbamoyladenosine biosynthesis protein TsaB